jgi:ribosomal protein S18 acetylase RimI-like enzyme
VRGGPHSSISIEEATEVSEHLVRAWQSLTPQLSSSAHAPGTSQIDAIVSSTATTLLMARDGAGRIVGGLTLAIFRVPTGVRAWIEDVVVDEAARGQGVGEALTREAVKRAVDAGARSVDLTSRPSREAANRLYAKLGFEKRVTNVYRLTLHDSRR